MYVLGPWQVTPALRVDERGSVVRSVAPQLRVVTRIGWGER